MGIGVAALGTFILAKIAGIKGLTFKHTLLVTGSGLVASRKLHELFLVIYLGCTGEEKIEECPPFHILSMLAALVTATVVNRLLTTRFNFDQGMGAWAVSPLLFLANRFHSPIAHSFHPHDEPSHNEPPKEKK